MSRSQFEHGGFAGVVANIEYFSVILIGIIYALYYGLKKRYSFWKELNVPGPEPVLFFGNIKENVTGKRFIGDVITDIYRQYPKEKCVGVYLTATPALLVRDLDLIKHILLKDFEYFNDRGLHFSEKGMGNNLFHADSETWSLLRKRMTPNFSSSKLKNMFYLVKDCADNFMKTYESTHPASHCEDIFQLTPKYTIGVICSCAFGLESSDQILDIGKKILEPNWKLLLQLIFPESLKTFDLSPFQKEGINFIYDFVEKVELERKGKPKIRNDLMDMLLEMKEEKYLVGTKVRTMERINLELTQSTIASQVLLFLVAGFETTASTMAYLLYELARNQHIQERVIEEIDRVFEEYNNVFTYEAIAELKYLEMVFYETLRKYPILDPLPRMSLTEYTLPGTDITIPKGMNILMSCKGIHYDPKYWPDPEKFDPDRFKPEEKVKRHPMSFLSFGEGPKICIGVRFAKISAFTGLAHFLRKYRVYATEDTPLDLDFHVNRFIYQPVQPLNVEIRKRNCDVF